MRAHSTISVLEALKDLDLFSLSEDTLLSTFLVFVVLHLIWFSLSLRFQDHLLSYWVQND